MLPLSTASFANSRQSIGSSFCALGLRRFGFLSVIGFGWCFSGIQGFEEQGSSLVVIVQGLGARVEVRQELLDPSCFRNGGVGPNRRQDGYASVGGELLQRVQ